MRLPRSLRQYARHYIISLMIQADHLAHGIFIAKEFLRRSFLKHDTIGLLESGLRVPGCQGKPKYLEKRRFRKSAIQVQLFGAEMGGTVQLRIKADRIFDIRGIGFYYIV